MRIIIISVSILLFSLLQSSAHAHDFWLSPSVFHNEKAPAKVPVKFLVGHADQVDSWTLNWDRIVALRAYSEGGFSDQLGGIVSNNALNQGLAMVSLDQSGTHVIGFESYHSISVLEGKKFNSYVEKEGLNAIAKDRISKRQENAPGRELYSRKAKTLVQVGDNFSENVTTPIGHTLEIVPLTNPYSLNEGEVLKVQILFRGQALANALIDLSPLGTASSDEVQAQRSDEKGIASFPLSRKGSWKLNVIWGVPNPGNNKAEYETYFSSLTYGF